MNKFVNELTESATLCKAAGSVLGFIIGIIKGSDASQAGISLGIFPLVLWGAFFYMIGNLAYAVIRIVKASKNQ